MSTPVDNNLERTELSDLNLGVGPLRQKHNTLEGIQVGSNSLTFGQGGNRLTLLGLHMIVPVFLDRTHPWGQSLYFT